MGEVIHLGREIAPEPETRPHLTGGARCLACKHEWVAVAEAGPHGYAGDLECPSCGVCRGQFKWPFQGPPDEQVWTCGTCDGQLFMITRPGTRCVSCGSHQVFP